MEVQDDSRFTFEGVLEKFSYAELSESTGGFCNASILGEGGFGVVYIGTLKWRSPVAIKRMNRDATQSQGMKEFKSEVAIISQVSHRNLIKLRGCYDDPGRGEYMLVYDLMPNGSLQDVLFETTEGTSSLSWPQKVKILQGTAEGLDYLHRGLLVIHRDIKCSNILLDQDWNAKVADFGIARLVNHQGRPATTEMAGTMGYIAPEVFIQHQFSDKADVFAFGVVCLEVACRRRVLSGAKNTGLVQMVRSAHSKGRLLGTVDRRHSEYDTEQMETVLKVGLLCTQPDPQNRPSMRDIVQMLAGEVTVPRMLSPGQWFLRECLALFKRERGPELIAASKVEKDRRRAAKNEEKEQKMAAKRMWELKMEAKREELALFKREKELQLIAARMVEKDRRTAEEEQKMAVKREREREMQAKRDELALFEREIELQLIAARIVEKDRRRAAKNEEKEQKMAVKRERERERQAKREELALFKREKELELIAARIAEKDRRRAEEEQKMAGQRERELKMEAKREELALSERKIELQLIAARMVEKDRRRAEQEQKMAVAWERELERQAKREERALIKRETKLQLVAARIVEKDRRRAEAKQKMAVARERKLQMVVSNNKDKHESYVTLPSSSSSDSDSSSQAIVAYREQKGAMEAHREHKRAMEAYRERERAMEAHRKLERAMEAHREHERAMEAHREHERAMEAYRERERAMVVWNNQVNYAYNTSNYGQVFYPNTNPHYGQVFYPNTTPCYGQVFYPNTTPHYGQVFYPNTTPCYGQVFYPNTTPCYGQVFYPNTTSANVWIWNY